MLIKTSHFNGELALNKHSTIFNSAQKPLVKIYILNHNYDDKQK